MIQRYCCFTPQGDRHKMFCFTWLVVSTFYHWFPYPQQLLHRNPRFPVASLDLRICCHLPRTGSKMFKDVLREFRRKPFRLLVARVSHRFPDEICQVNFRNWHLVSWPFDDCSCTLRTKKWCYWQWGRLMIPIKSYFSCGEKPAPLRIQKKWSPWGVYNVVRANKAKTVPSKQYVYIYIDRSSLDANTCQNIVLWLMTVLGLFSAMFAMARQQGFALQFAGERLQLDQEAWEVIVISPNSSLIIETSTRKTMENLGEYRWMSNPAKHL